MRFAAVLFGAMLAPYAANAQVDERVFPRVDAYITQMMRSARFPGMAVGIVSGDRVVHLRGFGRADPSGRSVTPQTPFLIGSVTKSFTALAVLQLVERGLVELDAPVQRYIPWFRVGDAAASSQITVRHLLTMTSGIPQVYETQLSTDRDDAALERTVRFLATKTLVGQPGRAFGYSNANYETLGLIVQAVSGESYEDYLKRHVFIPLDMRNTFVSQDEALRRGMASGHRWWFGTPVAVTMPYRRAELPAGYIIASTEDMTHFLIAEMNDGRYGNTPHGSSPLDGQTTRAMAHTVLSLVTNQPLPDQGIGHRRLALIFNAVIALLSVALVVSLARIRRRHRRMAHQGIATRSALGSRIAVAVALNLTLPIAFLYLSLAVPAWRALILFQPDLEFWLAGVATVLFIKGALELLFIARVYRQTQDAKFLTNRSYIGTRIVVVGGGIGGLAAARHLDRLLGGRHDVEITLVNRDNFFLLSPLLFEACSGVLELRHCAQPIRPCLRRVRFIEATAREIDVARRVVRVIGPDDALRELAYDHVVVALGAATNVSLIPGSQYARTFKTVADGLLLRNHVIEQLERAHVETDADRRRGSLTMTVIGGGLVGVELLGELTAFIEDELRYYPNIRRDELHFHLFEAGNRLLPESKPFLAEYAERVLRRRGVELHLATPVQEIGPAFVRWADERVESQTIVLAAGIVPNAVAAATNVARDRRGRIVTDATLRSTNDPSVWAFGDCASTPAPDGKPYPALAQHAVRAARVVARNVAAAVDGRPPEPFVYEPLGMMAAFGHTRAACDVRGLKLTGFIAWWMRRTYYLFQMPRWDTRFRIALDWTVSLFSRPDLTKIDLAEEREQEQRNGAASGSRAA